MTAKLLRRWNRDLRFAFRPCTPRDMHSVLLQGASSTPPRGRSRPARSLRRGLFPEKEIRSGSRLSNERANARAPRRAACHASRVTRECAALSARLDVSPPVSPRRGYRTPAAAQSNLPGIRPGRQEGAGGNRARVSPAARRATARLSEPRRHDCSSRPPPVHDLLPLTLRSFHVHLTHR